MALFLALALGAHGQGVERRVQFKPGSTSASFQATLDCSKARAECWDSYLLAGRKGDSLKIDFRTSAEASVDLWHGDFHNDPHTTATGRTFTLQLDPLPADGDYHVFVSPHGGSRIDYKVTFTLAPP